jgi:indole-3-acetate monooxygenase
MTEQIDEFDRALAPVIALARAEGAAFSRAGQLTAQMVELLRSAGIYRALAPRRFGGDERPPADFLRLVEIIAAADGSTGWVASFGCSARYLAALPIPTLAQIYRDGPDVIFSGATYPPRPVERSSTGYLVSGRWSWMSGITGADLIGVSIGTTEGAAGGLPLMAVMPRKQVAITGQWDPIGLRGTGSYDVQVDAVEVPEDWVFIRGGPASLDSPLFRYPSLALAAQSLAAVALGCGRGAVAELKAIANSHVSITGAKYRQPPHRAGRSRQGGGSAALCPRLLLRGGRGGVRPCS